MGSRCAGRIGKKYKVGGEQGVQFGLAGGGQRVTALLASPPHPAIVDGGCQDAIDVRRKVGAISGVEFDNRLDDHCGRASAAEPYRQHREEAEVAHWSFRGIAASARRRRRINA